MTKMIPLIGGPKNGEMVALPDTMNFKLVDFQEGLDDDSVLYTICQSGDGYFYGVYNPSSDDPSIARRDALRDVIRNAMEKYNG